MSTGFLQAAHLTVRSRICLDSALGYSEEKVRCYFILGLKDEMAGSGKDRYAGVCCTQGEQVRPQSTT